MVSSSKNTSFMKVSAFEVQDSCEFQASFEEFQTSLNNFKFQSSSRKVSKPLFKFQHVHSSRSSLARVKDEMTGLPPCAASAPTCGATRWLPLPPGASVPWCPTSAATTTPTPYPVLTPTPPSTVSSPTLPGSVLEAANPS